HEGDVNASIVKTTEQVYDRYGNITTYRDLGGLGVADDVIATIAYSSDNSSCERAHVLALPTTITVKNGETLLRERVATIDCPLPLVTEVSVTTEVGRHAITKLGYDSRGRITSVT